MYICSKIRSRILMLRMLDVYCYGVLTCVLKPRTLAERRTRFYKTRIFVGYLPLVHRCDLGLVYFDLHDGRACIVVLPKPDMIDG